MASTSRDARFRAFFRRALPGSSFGRSWLLPLAFALACSRGEGAPANGQRQGGGPGGPGGPGGRGRNDNQPTAVEVASVTYGSIAREATVAGILEPLRTVGVNAQIGGALLAVRVEEGSYVRAGQVVAEVDSREIAAQVRAAEASLVLAKSTAERSAQLVKQRVITSAEYERDQAALAAAQATLDQLRTRLGYATVRAPISGIITEKRVEMGDVVSAQTRLFSLADVSTIVLRAQVSELDVAGITPGQGADVTVDAFGSTRFRGTVRRVFPAADSATRMVPVEVAISGAAASRLKPGFMARATFRLSERPGVLVAPSRAVVGPVEARAVFLVRDGRAERRPVRIGQSSGDKVEILEGLRAGDSVIVAGTDNLRDGAAIRIVRPVGGDAAGARPAVADAPGRGGDLP